MQVRPSAELPPLVRLRDVGLWYRLTSSRHLSLKQLILRRRGAPRFERLWALRHVDLDLHEGQALAVVGPNGAGKSTLCLLLSAVLAPDEGELSVRARVSAVLSLSSGFDGDLTGRANIELRAAFLGISRRELPERMAEIIDFSELGPFIDQPLRSYSAGMRARLAFSIASAIEPELLILDEVLSVGDGAFRRKSRRRLQEMMDRSRLVVVVSHSPDFLRETCSHCVWLEGGRVRRFGDAPAVLDEYERVEEGRGAEA